LVVRAGAQRRRTIDTIDTIERAALPGVPLPGDWIAITAWAEDLVRRIGAEQPSHSIAVFVPDDRGGLRLAAQYPGAGLDFGEVVAAALVIPIDGSVSGRVYRSGLASLCADVALDADFLSVPGTRTRSSLTIPVGPPGAVRAVINLEATWISAFSIRDYERMTERAAAAYDAYQVRTIGRGSGPAIC
jgi:hypothetical protein